MTSLEGTVDIAALSMHIDSKRLSIAFFAWVVHEMVITSGDSVNLFWIHRWSISKVVFLMNQFAAVMTILLINALNVLTIDSASECVGLTASLFAGSLIIVCTVSFILGVRVWALWKGSYIILTIFFIVLAGNILFFLIIYGLALLRGMLLIFPPPFTGCTVVPNSKILWVMFSTTLVFEALATVLIVFKSWPLARLRGVETPLFSLLLEDGIGYCLVLIASKLFVVGAVYLPSIVATVTLPASICISASTLAANRLFLRLQQSMVEQKSGLTECNTAGLAFSRGMGGDGDGEKGITTFGGGGRTGRRVHARRHSHVDDELFSLGRGDVEVLSKKEETPDATDSTPHSSTNTTSASSSSVVVPVLDSKPCDAV